MKNVGLVVLCFLFVFSGMAVGQSKYENKDGITFVWDIEEGVLGYKLHYGTKSGEYNRTLDLGLRYEYTVYGLQKGKTYYFSITSYFPGGSESLYAREIAHTIH